MKDRAIVCNIVTSTTNPDRGPAQPEMDQHQAAGRRDTFPDKHRIVLLSEGRLVNLGNAMGHPSFVMSASFTNQTLAQIELFANTRRQVREEGLCAAQIARREGSPAASRQIGVTLTKLRPDQAEYIGVKQEGRSSRIITAIDCLSLSLDSRHGQASHDGGQIRASRGNENSKRAFRRADRRRGLSGIGAGYHLQQKCPNKSLCHSRGPRLHRRTWDLFRYPGVRSDSDMFTLGYSFRPWTEPGHRGRPANSELRRETAADKASTGNPLPSSVGVRRGRRSRRAGR